MKMPQNYTMKINASLGCLVAIAIFLSFTSCAKKAVFQTSSVVPAARGEVKVKKDNNKNYLIKVNVVNLAEPERLTPPNKNYVVWMVTENDGYKNIGQMNMSTGLFSKTLKGSLKTVSTFKPVKFFITGEDESVAQYPGMDAVLTTNSF